jgi:hypothetical protein
LNFVVITGRRSGIRFFKGMIDDFANDGKSFFRWELFPKVPKQLYESGTMPDEAFARTICTARKIRPLHAQMGRYLGLACMQSPADRHPWQ